MQQLLSEVSINSNNELQTPTHEENHIWVGELLKSIIYSGVDGTINTTIIILSGISSGTSAEKIFAITLAAIVGGGIDMACCDYTSAKAEMSFIRREEAKQLYEVENRLEDQKKQIVDIYIAKGFSDEDSARLSVLYATNSKAFVNIMMLQQLGLVVVEDQKLPIKCGIATLFSFLLFGFITFLPYLINRQLQINAPLWPIVLAISTVQLFSLGFAKASLLGCNKWKSGAQILVLGAVATGVGYGIGVAFTV